LSDHNATQLDIPFVGATSGLVQRGRPRGKKKKAPKKKKKGDSFGRGKGGR